MRVLSHFPLKSSINIGRIFFGALAVSAAVHAFAQTPVELPPPPRIVDAPAPSATSPRSTVRSAPTPTPTAAAAVAPTLEQSLVPEAKPLPADPAQRALENARRAVPPQGKSREAVAAKLNRVEVEGLRPDQRDVVKEAFDRNLPAPKRTGIEEVVLDNGARCIINHDCVGPFCSNVCTAGNGALGNQRPGGVSLQ